MSRSTLLFFIFSCLLMHSASAQYYLAHINIVNVENGNISSDQTVFIKGDRIMAISAQTPLAPKEKIYDCSSKYLIPGLWDMHIHDAGDSDTRFEYIPLFIANGVTGVRDMWGSPEMLLLKKEIDDGHFIGPRMMVGSPIIEGAVGFFSSTPKAATVEQGRLFVDSFAKAGYDFIKIYSTIKEPVYLAIADECRKMKIPMEGHLPVTVSFEEAIDAGQRSFEHNFAVNRALIGNETKELQWARHYLDTASSLRHGEYMVHGEPLHLTVEDCKLPQEVINKMKKNRVAVVPTLTLARGRSTSGEIMASETKGLEYLTDGFVNYWKKQAPVFPPEFVQTFGTAAKFFMKSGVLVLAGTDVNNPFCVPGFGLQQELVNLHEAGLTNLEVLQTATINAAKFLYKEKQLGTVEAGKFADLVVLDDNPLTDISHTQLIHAVILNGKYFSREDIQQMLAAQKIRQHHP